MTFKDIVYGSIVPIVDFAIIPLLYAFAFLFFLMGIFNLFFTDNEEKRKSGRQFAIWGVIGFAVISSVWGLVRFMLALLQGGV